MHKITFFPLGNADCSLIDLECGKKVLFDYANTKEADNEDDLRCDLEQELRDDLENDDRDSYDVVAFTHLDEDHYKGATDFFWFDHAKKYQGDDRIKIDTMWVPAAVITETGLDKDEAKIIQKEAMHRFKNGTGIRVFSRPDRLKEWCKNNDVDFGKRKHIITDAGQIAPEFGLNDDGAEFFVHSPFAKRLDDGTVEDRNEDALVMHVTFSCEEVETRVFLMADAPHEILADIVNITEARSRAERLEFDVSKLPHHCSYLSLGPEKGKEKTKPVKEVKRLYEKYGQDGCIIVSTSKPIPSKGSDEDKDSQPPHRQAANYYKEDAVDNAQQQFKVTMEHPKSIASEPLVIEIDGSKATIRKRMALVGAVAANTPAPRAGRHGK